MTTHYVVVIDVKRVTRQPGNLASKADREITDLLHVSRTVNQLPIGVEYAIHVLSELAQRQDVGLDSASVDELYSDVRQKIVSQAGPRGIDPDDASKRAADMVEMLTRRWPSQVQR